MERGDDVKVSDGAHSARCPSQLMRYTTTAPTVGGLAPRGAPRVRPSTGKDEDRGELSPSAHLCSLEGISDGNVES